MPQQASCTPAGTPEVDPHAYATGAVTSGRHDGRVRLRDPARTFFLIGLTSYGGPAIVAQLRAVTVHKKGWLTDDEFQESLAFCQTLPRPIAVQTAAHAGWRIRGPLGALLVTVAYVIQTFRDNVGANRSPPWHAAPFPGKPFIQCL